MMVSQDTLIFIALCLGVTLAMFAMTFVRSAAESLSYRWVNDHRKTHLFSISTGILALAVGLATLAAALMFLLSRFRH